METTHCEVENLGANNRSIFNVHGDLHGCIWIDMSSKYPRRQPSLGAAMSASDRLCYIACTPVGHEATS